MSTRHRAPSERAQLIGLVALIASWVALFVIVLAQLLRPVI